MLSKNERRRRLWAAEQSPELVTTDQALEMFGHKSFNGFRRFLISNGIAVMNYEAWPNCSFYVKSDVEKLAETYLKQNPKRQSGAKKLQEASAETKPPRVLHTFTKFIPDYGWTEEQFADYWDTALDHKATADIFRRSPTIFTMKSEQACALVLILTNRVMGINGGVNGYRLDKSVFVRIARSTAKTKAESIALQKAVSALHQRSEIGKLDPEKTVRVIYELLTSAPNSPPPS